MQNLEKCIVDQLIEKALDARKTAYAPYSGYSVGAAILCEDGSIVTGSNIENASYGMTNCAERTAAFHAVHIGKRRFRAIAIAGGKGDYLDYAFPCGACRQVLREFCQPTEFDVFICKSVEDYKYYTLEQLLPESFGPDNLK